jgi:hypothetical protein
VCVYARVLLWRWLGKRCHMSYHYSAIPHFQEILTALHTIPFTVLLCNVLDVASYFKLCRVPDWEAEGKLRHAIQLFVNYASILVAPQNKQGLKLNYFRQPMWYSEFKPLRYTCRNTQTSATFRCLRTHKHKNIFMTGHFADYILHKYSSNDVKSSVTFALNHLRSR